MPLNKVPFHPAFDYAQASVSALHVRYSISERIPYVENLTLNIEAGAECVVKLIVD